MSTLKATRKIQIMYLIKLSDRCLFQVRHEDSKSDTIFQAQKNDTIFIAVFVSGHELTYFRF